MASEELEESEKKFQTCLPKYLSLPLSLSLLLFIWLSSSIPDDDEDDFLMLWKEVEGVELREGGM